MAVIRFLLSAAAGLSVLSAVAAAAGDIRFMREDFSGIREEVEAAPDGWASARLADGGETMFFCEPDRRKFRPERGQIWKRFLRVDAEVTAETETPVEIWWFVKDKTGRYYQDVRSETLLPGERRTLTIPLDAGSGRWRAVGHRADWSALEAATVFTVGWKLRSDGAAEVRFSPPRFEGERHEPEFQIIGWDPPRRMELYRRTAMRFELSREYFNPFDPGEISIDAEVSCPDGSKVLVPAFFSREHRRRFDFSGEIVEPVGRPYWEVRFTPTQNGRHRIRLLVTDSSTGEAQTFSSFETEFEVAAGEKPRRGFVRRDGRGENFFCFDNGEGFFPIGLNIHTNIDLRSETAFGYPPLGDGGTRDYDEYFRRCAEYGINCVEIWMAAWTFAIEWSCERTDYYGLGRYNLVNAWRLDYLIGEAERLGIYIHLVLDNHGKISSTSDPEWKDSPYNLKGEFAAANGACLESAGEFFRSIGDGNPAAEYYRRRNRYIAARWGAETAVFAFELWSENDLTDEFQANYDASHVTRHLDWASKELRKLDSGKHLMTTHVCSDFNNNLRRKRLWEPELFEYVASDAYYDTNSATRFVELLRRHRAGMNEFKRPTLVTEFGGSSGGGAVGRIVADIHSGLWGSYFLGLAGTPFLWWHDFALEPERGRHYRGFADFIAGIDRGDPAWKLSEPAVPAPDQNTRLEAMVLTRPGERLGWVFRHEPMYSYPLTEKEMPVVVHAAGVPLPGLGTGAVVFYDPLSGKVVERREISAEERAAGRLMLPDFRIDIAFKLEEHE